MMLFSDYTIAKIHVRERWLISPVMPPLMDLLPLGKRMYTHPCRAPSWHFHADLQTVEAAEVISIMSGKKKPVDHIELRRVLHSSWVATPGPTSSRPGPPTHPLCPTLGFSRTCYFCIPSVYFSSMAACTMRGLTDQWQRVVWGGKDPNIQPGEDGEHKNGLAW